MVDGHRAELSTACVLTDLRITVAIRGKYQTVSSFDVPCWASSRVPIAMMFQTSRRNSFEPFELEALAYSLPTGCSMMMTLRRAWPERVDAIAALI